MKELERQLKEHGLYDLWINDAKFAENMECSTKTIYRLKHKKINEFNDTLTKRYCQSFNIPDDQYRKLQSLRMNKNLIEEAEQCYLDIKKGIAIWERENKSLTPRERVELNAALSRLYQEELNISVKTPH